MLGDVNMTPEQGSNPISKLSNTANIEIPKMESGFVMEIPQTNAVSIPNKVESIAVDKRNIKKIRDLCEHDEENSFWISDFYLGISTLAISLF